MDVTDIEVKEKMAILNKIYAEYELPLEFYGRLKSALHTNFNK